MYNLLNGEIPKRLKGSVSKTDSRFTPSRGSNPLFSASKLLIKFLININFSPQKFVILKKPPFFSAVFVNFYYRNYFPINSSSIALAACFPAPIARITVAAPVTASPPA